MKVKNIFLVPVLLLLSLTTSLAQQMHFGVKAGVNYSSLSGVAGGETEYLPGFHAGLFTEYRLSPLFAIQAELLYSQEGAESFFRMETEEYSLSSERKLKLAYLNLPVMGKFYFTDGFSLQAGPQVGYLLSARDEFIYFSDFSQDTNPDSGSENVKNELKKVSLGLNFGIGYDWKETLFLQARYYLALSDINKYEDEINEYERDFENIKNRGFQLSVGYKF